MQKRNNVNKKTQSSLMGKHNIDQRSHINKRIIYQKMIMKVVLNKWEMPHFKSRSVFSKNVSM